MPFEKQARPPSEKQARLPFEKQVNLLSYKLSGIKFYTGTLRSGKGYGF